MTEDDMLRGITQALTLGGWTWTHSRRSDQALTMGTPGVPDIIAVHPKRGMLVLELKSERGTFRPGQQEWLATLAHVGVDARVIRPADYDALIREVVR